MANIIKITDINKPELDVFVRLTGAQLRNKLEPDKGIFIAESPTVISVALGSGCEPISMLTDERLLSGEGVPEIIERVGDIPIYTAERDTLKTLTGFELTRGALCAMKRPVPKSASELCRDAKRIAVLEAVTDSTNIGALFRSAAALGIDAVLITPTCCDPLCRRAIRVSMGTVFQVPWARIGDTPSDWPEKGLRLLSELGFKTAAMALRDDTVSIDDPRLQAEDRLAIILGTEGDGLSKSTIASCDYTVKIPMSHGVDSLNVAAAGAVAFWILGKR
ncbi:MAG: RNA methyltransferase [Ruminococcaceae bacterium]|nr:RNA methyltransferase [Oscillospiraceae bacterium]